MFFFFFFSPLISRRASISQVWCRQAFFFCREILKVRETDRQILVLAAVTNILFGPNVAGPCRCLQAKKSICWLQMHQLSDLCKQNRSNWIKWKICRLLNKEKHISSREHKGRFVLTVLSKGEVQPRHACMWSQRCDITQWPCLQ